jgi:hypothetical protein
MPQPNLLTGGQTLFRGARFFRGLAETKWEGIDIKVQPTDLKWGPGE